MAVQTSYGFSPSRGVAGGLYDMSLSLRPPPLLRRLRASS